MKHLLIILVFQLLSYFAFGQLERKLQNENEPEELTFHAPRHINLLTVEPLESKNLHFAIMHTFGTIDNGAQNLWGLDNGANIRFSLEYGLMDRLSVGFGRSSLDKVFDLFARYHVLQQTKSNSMPFSLSLMANTARNTANYDFIPSPPSGSDRQSFAAQIMIARKFSDRISLQVSPIFAQFNRMMPIYQVQGTDDFYSALGFSGKWRITNRTSITGQWIANHNNDLKNNVGVGIDMEAGGHVFQVYFVTSQALNEQYLLAGGNGNPGEKFRLGFNVNRIFQMGNKG